jgi:ribonuclease Z
MKLYFLGTSAGVPTTVRNVSSLALMMPEYQGDTWLFDCGEATQHQILRSPIRLSRISRIYITHLHGDHLYGLPGLLSTRAFQAESAPLVIYGPEGLQSFIETSLSISQTHLPYPLEILEITDGTVINDRQFTISVRQLEHGIPSYGFRIEEKERLGKLDMKGLKAVGVKPGPILQQLKRGEQVTLHDGRTIDGRQYLSPPTPGKVIAICGDTLPTANAHFLAQNADVLVHEATHMHQFVERAARYSHSSTIQAATLARDAGVKQLIVNHLSPRYHDILEEELVTEVRSVFPNAYLANEHQEYEC